MDIETIKAIIGFLIFIFVLVSLVQWLAKNKQTEKILNNIEKGLLFIKIPNFLVQILLWIIVMIPYCIILFMAVFLVDYLGLM